MMTDQSRPILSKTLTAVFKIVAGIQSSWLTPPPLRRFLLNSIGAKLHKKSHIGQGVLFFGRHITMGNECSIGARAIIGSNIDIILKAGARVGPACNIMTVTHVMGDSKRRSNHIPVYKPKIIGTGVWIGQAAIILPGVDIADGCVIAAGSVVTKSTEPNGLYAGVPAARKKDLPL